MFRFSQARFVEKKKKEKKTKETGYGDEIERRRDAVIISYVKSEFLRFLRQSRGRANYAAR